MEFKGIAPAYRAFCNFLRSKEFRVDETNHLNENRYIISNCKFFGKSEVDLNFKIMFIFRRDTFHSFGSRFGLGEKEGESINEEDFQIALNRGVKKVYIFYPNGKIYSISSFDLEENGKLWKCNEGKDIRSIPFDILTLEGEIGENI